MTRQVTLYVIIATPDLSNKQDLDEPGFKTKKKLK
jgi:hypothetical protein